MWCVGLCLRGGLHRYRVFDDYEGALDFAGFCRRKGAGRVFLWEL